jgi:ParB family chromosome partitioning protein
MEPVALEELADSIRAQGVVQPIVVRPLAKKDTYEIIAGERRWRAARIAGLTKVPVIVRNVSDNAAMAIGLIENIQRENLNPIEEANALRRLIDEFEMTHEQCAEAVGRSRASVSNLLRLIELNNDVKLLLEKRQIEMGHARALLGLNGAEQSRLAAVVVERKLSVRETEQLVRKSRLPVIPGNKNKAATENPDIRRLQDNLSEQLGAAVKIDHKAVGKGKLVIQYNTLDELDGILAHIK